MICLLTEDFVRCIELERDEMTAGEWQSQWKLDMDFQGNPFLIA